MLQAFVAEQRESKDKNYHYLQENRSVPFHKDQF